LGVTCDLNTPVFLTCDTCIRHHHNLSNIVIEIYTTVHPPQGPKMSKIYNMNFEIIIMHI
jgi:hypothetical protein